MREIKFRAWDKLGKEMFRVIMLSFPMGQKRIIVSGRGGSTDTGNNDCILMQYTGLKDKNGKEIYEGDIIKWKDKGSNYPEVITKIQAVEIKNLNRMTPMLFDKTEYEVIGNIYENPELLK